MEIDFFEERNFSHGLVTGISFNVLNEADIEKISVAAIEAVNEVIDPKLGIPNLLSQCSTCGAKDSRCCEGHFGIIKFPYTVLHPYFLAEVAEILNKICPGCKSIRHDIWKRDGNITSDRQKVGCRYCIGFSSDWYPPMKFKVTTKDLYKKTAITVVVSEKLPPKKFNNNLRGELPPDYWDFIPKDENQQECSMKPYSRVLSHAQVHYFLKDVDPQFIQEFASEAGLFFLNSFLITPNCHRVTEAQHNFSFGPQMVFDERTRAYKKLVDFRGEANELGSRVLDCLKISKLCSDKTSNNPPTSNVSGSKWFKEVVLGKRSDHSFRMVVVGDPNIRIDEVGIPCNIAESLQISENLNSWNWEKLNDVCNIRLFQTGAVYIRRNGRLVHIRHMNELELGDTMFRSLDDGDIVLINRPPSIHQHSHIALSVKVLPIKSAVSINPFVCLPLRGDFDGDCLHGYIPQAVESRVELGELVALNQQLINGQSGRNLLSFSQDCLTAAHLVTVDGILLNRFQMQQLVMFCPRRLPLPAIVKAFPIDKEFWTGKQLFSMLLPDGFDYAFQSNGVCISDGELITSDGSGWLRNTVGDFYNDIVKYCKGQTLDFLHVAQNVLCEWLSMRGLSVSLSDLYVSSDRESRQNLMGEVLCGLQEAQQMCLIKQLMVDSCLDFLVGDNGENTSESLLLDVERMCYERQKSAAVGQAYVFAFRDFFWDIQGLVYQYSGKDNALLAMLKAGSKGSLLKLVQHSMCVGLQHSMVPLSFRLPHTLSCATWNNQKAPFHNAPESAQSFIPYAVIENSFLAGLNPLECFVHSLTSRDSSFSDNADVPGTLTRRLMFFLRDISIAYDGTVRNAYGNRVVQFCYNISKDVPTSSCNVQSRGTCESNAGQPVGSLSACAISEAAYSALDQPLSTLEISPLLNFKNILECGLRKFSANQTVTLFLSKKLRRWIHGFENGVLEVKNHLERLLFSDIVSDVMIMYSSSTGSKKHMSPWVCHFHVVREMALRKKLQAHSIIDALNVNNQAKCFPFNIQIISEDCSCYGEGIQEKVDTFCIEVQLLESSKNSFIQLDTIIDAVIPALLETVVKGFPEIKKVDILWNDGPDVSKSRNIASSGELYLRVHMSEQCGKMKFWSSLLNNCLQIWDMIDWERSHSNDVHGVLFTYGVDAAWKFFLSRFQSVLDDIGRVILLEHLILVANCLSATGEFVGLNSSGLERQRKETCVSSPFLQACFSNPSTIFIKAAKEGALDNLVGSVDALAWGKFPSTGTGGNFDIIYATKEHEISKPEDIYHILRKQIGLREQNGMIMSHHSSDHILSKHRLHHVQASGFILKKSKALGNISKSFLKTLGSLFSYDDVQKLSHRLKSILFKYPINSFLSEDDKDILLFALYFHPRKNEKIGSGAKEIKVGYHSEHETSRCFLLVRTDGSVEDFSYHKCVLGALENIAPHRAINYRSKWLPHSTRLQKAGDSK